LEVSIIATLKSANGTATQIDTSGRAASRRDNAPPLLAELNAKIMNTVRWWYTINLRLLPQTEIRPGIFGATQAAVR
jgi:hypothetical protein